MNDDELRALAEAATPEEWASGGDEVYAGQGETYTDICRMTCDESVMDANADYIAALSPSTVLGLLDRLAEAEGFEDVLGAAVTNERDRLLDRLAEERAARERVEAALDVERLTLALNHEIHIDIDHGFPETATVLTVARAIAAEYARLTEDQP